MRVSQFYRLKRSQPTLPFVDVNLDGDTRLFINPRSIRLLESEFGDECVSLIQSFFQTVINSVKSGDHDKALRLLKKLKEPNETHLGLSTDVNRGRGLAGKKAEEIWLNFANSKAAKSGLLTDLEDTVLFVDGVREDIISDITTNIIRAPLIKFTQDVCRYFRIPLFEGINSGPIWDPHQKNWSAAFVDLPMPNDDKLLLVPKELVRIRLDYDPDKYYQHYILEYLQDSELGANSELVKTMKDGTKFVTKKDCTEKHGRGKSIITDVTLKDPDILKRYKEEHDKPSRPLTHAQFADAETGPRPNWDQLLHAVVDVATGNDEASNYEAAVEALLTALFYPHLTHPQPQNKIHEGRKRIDISYTNMAPSGFFYWLSLHHPCGKIFFECKNYGKEIENPELDQMAGRFGPNRGRFGVIVCRKLKNRSLFERRCRDTALDGKGFIIVLDDNDLSKLTTLRKDLPDDKFFDLPLFRKRFEALT